MLNTLRNGGNYTPPTHTPKLELLNPTLELDRDELASIESRRREVLRLLPPDPGPEPDDDDAPPPAPSDSRENTRGAS
jgi:hypothetical protein